LSALQYFHLVHEKTYMKHWIQPAGLLAFGIAIIGAPVHAQLARVTATERTTEKRVSASGSWQKATRGEALGVGDGLRTGRRSKADLKFADGSLLRLGQLSTVELKSAKGASLTGGRLLFSMLKPGRVLAGTAAAEIKGSVGIISIDEKGGAEFTLYSGAMDVVMARETISVPPGQAMSVFADGSRSPLRPAPPLRFEGGAQGSSLLDAPSDAPFIGSRADLRERFAPDRLAIDAGAALVKQRDSAPFPQVVVPPPVVTPPVVTPPVVPPVEPPVVVPPPVVEPPVVTPPVVNPPIEPPVVTPPVEPPVVTPPTGGNGGGNEPGDNDPDDGDNGEGNDDKDDDDNDRPGRPNDALQLATNVRALKSGGASTNALRFGGSPAGGMALQLSPTRLALASSAPVKPSSPREGVSAEEHILESNPGLGRSFGGDATGLALVSGGGSRLGGARLRAIATRGPLLAEIAVSPGALRFGSGQNERRFTLSDASLTLRLNRGDLQVGRQRFLSGPVVATLSGSMLRQGGRQVMDAVTFRPNIGAGANLQFAYLNDAFVRDLPFNVSGNQRGFYGRAGIERRVGNFGLNVLRYSDVRTANQTGVTLDFALPIVRNGIEFYGEVGRDPFKRNLRTFGFAFPGLQDRLGLDLFLEHSALSNPSGVLEAPDEFALLAYKRLRAGVFLSGGFSHFSNGRNLGTVGLAFGSPNASGNR
jgi:hypothetical protein